MSNEHKPQQKETPHKEQPVYPEPMEEFVDDKSIPSKPMKAEKPKSSSSPQRMHDVKPAGHQDNKPELFEPGVEG